MSSSSAVLLVIAVAALAWFGFLRKRMRGAGTVAKRGSRDGGLFESDGKSHDADGNDGGGDGGGD